MPRIDQIKIFLPVFIACLLLAACTPQATPAPAASTAAVEVQPTATSPQPSGTSASPVLTFTDGLGRIVKLAGPAQHIVSLAASNTEILYAIGAGKQVVARDDFSDYPAEVSSLPKIGGSFAGYNNEAIVNIKPDLVLAAEINTPEQVKALEGLGVTVYYLSNPKDMQGLYKNLEIVAALTGHESEAATLVESLKKRVEAVTTKTQSLATLPKVFYELDSTDPNAPYTAGAGTFIDTLIQMAGGQNVGSVLKSPYGQISSEELLVQNPDVILLGDSAYGVTAESLTKRAGWEKIKAVQDGKIFPFDDNLVSRPGPRMVDGLETIAKLLHPELFK